MQADGEGARRPAEPRPLAAGQRSSTDCARAGNPAPSHTLLAHHTRLRLAGDRCRHDGHSELPQRDDQVHRQELSGCRWSRRVGVGHRRQPQTQGQGRCHSQVDVDAAIFVDDTLL